MVFHKAVLSKVWVLLSWVYTLTPCKNTLLQALHSHLTQHVECFQDVISLDMVWVCSRSHQIALECLHYISAWLAVKTVVTVRFYTKKCCLPIHLVVLITLQVPWVRLMKQMVKLKINDKTGEHDFPKHRSLMEAHQDCRWKPMAKPVHHTPTGSQQEVWVHLNDNNL